jgi:hypothetical protein
MAGWGIQVDIPPLRLRFAQGAMVIGVLVGCKSQTPVGMTINVSEGLNKEDDG